MPREHAYRHRLQHAQPAHAGALHVDLERLPHRPEAQRQRLVPPLRGHRDRGAIPAEPRSADAGQRSGRPVVVIEVRRGPSAVVARLDLPFLDGHDVVLARRRARRQD